MRIPIFQLRNSVFFAGVFFASQAFALEANAPAMNSPRTVVQADKEMVTTGDWRGSQAGFKILQVGGSAVDAAIAAQLVLNLVDPQSAGIGGGAILMFWDQKNQKITALDGRETAPSAATPERFLKADGTPLSWEEAYPGGRSVGVPGFLRMAETAHKKWGKLPWKDVLAPALALAENGYEISPRLNLALTTEAKTLTKDPVALAFYYTQDGQPKPVGTVLKNPAFAQTLRTISEKGADGFYSGAIAEDIVAAVTQHSTNPGDMTLDDLKNYAAKEREVVCGPYRAYKVCGFGPPSSGGIAVTQILGILQSKDLAPLKGSVEAVHWFAEATRLAFADRNQFVADSDFVDVPVKGLIDPAYLRNRAALMTDKDMGTAPAGEPGKQSFYMPSAGIEHGTNHSSIVDRDGNAVSMTTTIEYRFGSQIMTKDGFMLNNQLTDFSFKPKENDKPVANSVEAGKRPRTSMSPSLVFDKDDKLYAVIGSAGGANIITAVAQGIVALVDWNMDPQQATALSHYGNRNSSTELEENTDAIAYKADLEAKGHAVKIGDMMSSMNIVLLKDGKLWGGVDPRREGLAIGD